MAAPFAQLPGVPGKGRIKTGRMKDRTAASALAALHRPAPRRHFSHWCPEPSVLRPPGREPAPE